MDLAKPADATRAIVLDMQKTINVDNTGLEILEALRRKIAKNVKTLIITEADIQPLSLFQRSGFSLRLGAENLLPSLAAGAARGMQVAKTT